MHPARPYTSRGALTEEIAMPSTSKPCAVLIDGSALFLASRAISDSVRPEASTERPPRLDYRALIDVLKTNIQGLADPDPVHRASIWTMWTAASSDNPGQQSFLDFTEKMLKWEIRKFTPSQSFMVEPATVLGISSESGKGRLTRFDASIAYAIGRLADTHRIVVVTDSFPLADPLARLSAQFGATSGKPILAFYGRSIDPRWYVVFREASAPEFINLDDFEAKLFGLPQKEDLGGPSRVVPPRYKF
jgi:hypothetical protein